jgi:guanylate kinase
MKKVNQLSNLALYKKLSLNYEPAASVIKQFSKTKYSPLIGIASSGRDTIMNNLKLRYPNYFYDLITTTTRNPRINNGILEQNGREYFFISEQEFHDKIKNCYMLEWAVIHNQQLSGLDYETFGNAPKNKYIINDIEVSGALNLISYSNIIKPIFIVPPSFKTWDERLKARGVLNEEELKNRIISARNEITLALKEPKFHFVINDDLNRVSDEIFNYIDRNIILDQSKPKTVAMKILSNLSRITDDGI